MSKSIIIIDDDVSVRKMLTSIINSNNIGRVFTELEDGFEAVDEILFYQPNIVLVDMLLPGLDGLSIINQAIRGGFKGKFIMISQVEDPIIKSKAYQLGAYFFVSKPINQVEVISVIKQVSKILDYEESLNLIRSTVTSIEQEIVVPVQNNLSNTIDKIFSDIGIINESGAKDLKEVIILYHKQSLQSPCQEILLKDVYHKILEDKIQDSGQTRNLRSFEQKVRRLVLKSLHTLAHIGIDDYYSIRFMDYATSLFDLQHVRQEIKFINEESSSHGKVNIKKFIDGIISKL